MQGVLLPGWIGAAVALLILIAFTYTQFRHAGLALVAALAPLPGTRVAVVLHMPAHPLAYLCGFVVSLMLTSGIEARIRDGAPRREAMARGMSELLPILVWPIALAVCATVLPALVAKGFVAPVLSLILTVALCGAAALICTPVGLAFLPYPDDFITRANRLRERRERWLDWLTFVVQPRWGWSVGGIALIFAVLGFFGGADSGAIELFAAPAGLPIALGLFAIFAYMATRDMRRTAALVLTSTVLMCLMFWINARIAIDPAMALLAIALAAMPALILAGQSSAFVRAGDTMVVAILRGFERCAVPTIFYCLAATLALCISSEYAAAILVLCGGVAALLFFPALTTAIYDFFPPRVSLDAYRVR
ncbi:MAG: hypothetical protein JSR55_09460 [Proteobacteria bacterium]|nr:hypothetical protein [Pseudomonadota bacterium]